MSKKILTSESGMVYAESLKTATIGFRTRQICDFFVFANWRMRAENILNISQGSIVAAFSESATFHNCVAFLKKATKMTNTLIQILGKSYNQIKQIKVVDESVHGSEAVDAFWDVYFALQKAISSLQPLTAEDRKIKLEVLKDLFEGNYSDDQWEVHIEDMDAITRIQYDIVNQLATE
jgi:hypothetical protein